MSDIPGGENHGGDEQDPSNLGPEFSAPGAGDSGPFVEGLARFAELSGADNPSEDHSKALVHLPNFDVESEPVLKQVTLSHYNYDLRNALFRTGLNSLQIGKAVKYFRKFGKKHFSPMADEDGLDAVVVTKSGGTIPPETHILNWSRMLKEESSIEVDSVKTIADISFALIEAMALPRNEREPEVQRLMEVARDNQLEMTGRIVTLPLRRHWIDRIRSDRLGWFPHEVTALGAITAQTLVDESSQNRLAVARDLTVLLPLLGKTAWDVAKGIKPPDYHRTATITTFHRMREDVVKEPRYVRRTI